MKLFDDLSVLLRYQQLIVATGNENDALDRVWEKYKRWILPVLYLKMAKISNFAIDKNSIRLDSLRNTSTGRFSTISRQHSAFEDRWGEVCVPNVMWNELFEGSPAYLIVYVTYKGCLHRGFSVAMSVEELFEIISYSYWGEREEDPSPISVSEFLLKESENEEKEQIWYSSSPSLPGTRCRELPISESTSSILRWAAEFSAPDYYEPRRVPHANHVNSNLRNRWGGYGRPGR